MEKLAEKLIEQDETNKALRKKRDKLKRSIRNLQECFNAHVEMAKHPKILASRADPNDNSLLFCLCFLCGRLCGTAITGDFYSACFNCSDYPMCDSCTLSTKQEAFFRCTGDHYYCGKCGPCRVCQEREEARNRHPEEEEN